MKKIVILIIFIAIPLLVNAQLNGSGTYSDPWNGTLTADANWNGTIYIDGDIIVDNEKLTISPGAIIIFLSESANLKITGTGQLEANGTTGNMIRFTSDDDNDGSYGESGERWGHISFQSMGPAGLSTMSYCIVEFGYKTGSGIEGYGGGIHSDFNNLAISDCIIRNNYAQWGGGIFINQNRNPSISNCMVINNQSIHGGGGFYFWNRSSSIITNCIFDSNHSLETTIPTYTGGGLAAQTSCAIKVINCTFVNNLSDRPEGQAILLDRSNNSKVINSIFWGSSEKQIYCYGTTSANNIINCAYRGITYTTGAPVNPIVLNSTNSASDGPNFNAINGSDWSIKLTSPCRDAGTTPSPSVLTDFLGNSRIGPYDIGAYEVQYSRWKTTAGTTDWNTGDNWDGGVPSLTRDVIIPTGASLYPTTAPGPDFTIGSGKQMIIEPGARVTLNSLTNNGIIKLNHNATDFASLILNNYTRGTGGTEEIQLYLEGGGSALLNDYKWHYISTPVSSLSTDVFTVNTYNLAQFIESRVSLDLLQGWVAFDGYVYSGGTGPTFNTFTPGKGYNYFNDVGNTYTFGGLFNTSSVTSSLSFNGVASIHGFNLLGNPFPAGLNWDDIIEGVYYPYPANTSKGLYFTHNNEQCSYIAGVGVPSSVNGIIPPMQGFFTKTYSINNSITLPLEARTHNNIPSRYKGETIIPLVRLAIFENVVSNDETVVRFNDLAKSDLDNDYDALKMFLSANKTSIHTSAGGINFAINGQPFPESIVEIPVIVNVVSAGTHKISATQLQGLDNYNISLRDKTTGFTANLKTNPELTFSASAGSISDRFTLTISNASTGTGDINSLDNNFIIYHNFDKINIQTLADDWNGKTGSVKVLDMAGKVVSDLQNTEFSKTSVTQVQAPALNGLYLLEIRSGVKRYVGKVVVR